MIPGASPVLAALGAVAKLLAEHDVDWAVLGALAANVYRAAARTTFDVDLLVAVGHAGMGAIAESAEREGWEIRHLHPEGSLLRIAHDEHGAVDLLAVEMDYQHKALSRARTETLAGGIPARVLAVEDVIIHKLIANRAQDDADIAAILEAQEPMDVGYLEYWTQVWEVGDRFAAILERHRLAPPEPQHGSRRAPPAPHPPGPDADGGN